MFAEFFDLLFRDHVGKKNICIIIQDPQGSKVLIVRGTVTKFGRGNCRSMSLISFILGFMCREWDYDHLHFSVVIVFKKKNVNHVYRTC